MAFDPSAPPSKGSTYGGTGTGVTDTGPKPIGVPKGFTTSHMGRGSFGRPTHPVTKPASYFVGDEYGSVAGFPKDPSDIAQLQQYLVQSGLLDDKKVVYGQWDPVSAKAFSAILASANATGTEWQTTLAQRLNLADQQELLTRNDKAPPQVPPVRLTSPDDLRATAKTVSQQLYGGNLPDADVERFVSAYQSMESGYQQGINADTAGGTYTQPPAPDVAIEKQIRTDHPNQVAATAFGARMGDIISTFTGNGR